ncbi:MAG TPA: divalent-cation tolerance protein CutA [Rhodanobacteraceae bacterium]|nr:divalent-cation tolerance protein CutA [Rhodanobacteraceae bacterium]
MTALVAFSTCPDASSATHLARALVEEGLAACVNQLPGVTSTYRWQGEVHEDTEVLLLIKTTAGRFADLDARLRELHPYELPELIAWPISDGNADYLAWLGQATRRTR